MCYPVCASVNYLLNTATARWCATQFVCLPIFRLPILLAEPWLCSDVRLPILLAEHWFVLGCWLPFVLSEPLIMFSCWLPILLAGHGFVLSCWFGTLWAEGWVSIVFLPLSRSPPSFSAMAKGMPRRVHRLCSRSLATPPVFFRLPHEPLASGLAWSVAAGNRTSSDPPELGQDKQLVMCRARNRKGKGRNSKDG